MRPRNWNTTRRLNKAPDPPSASTDSSLLSFVKMSDHNNNLTGLTPERRALLALKARRLKERGGKNAGEPPILPQPRQEGVNLFPPSPAQERLWFLDQLVPGSSAFNLAIPMHLRGALHISTLKRSLDAMLERHEVLRTNLLTKDG